MSTQAPAPEATVLDFATAVLDWHPFEMPRSSVSVDLARVLPDRHVALVRFPAGWRRDAAGSYEANEEFTILTGGLHMSGAIYVAPHWAYVPAGYLRTTSHVHRETLAIARFDGPPRWRDDEGDDTIRVLESTPLGRARELRPGATHLLDGTAAGPAPATTELLSPELMRWAWVPAGAPMPAWEGPVIARTVEEDR